MVINFYLNINQLKREFFLSGNLVLARDVLSNRYLKKRDIFFRNFLMWIKDYGVLLPSMGEIHSFIANGRMKINFKCFESRFYKNREFLNYLLSRFDSKSKIKEKEQFYKLKFKNDFDSFEMRKVSEKRFCRDMNIHYTGVGRKKVFDKIKIPKIKIEKPKVENLALKKKLQKNEFYEKYMKNQRCKQKFEPICGCTKFDYCSTHYAQSLKLDGYRYTTNNLTEVL